MATPAANSIEGIAAPFVERIEALNREIDSEREAYQARCKAIRASVKLTVLEAKEQGVTEKALKGIVKWRALERKKDAIADGLDIDEQSQFESLVAALGDFASTELGEAAIKAA